LAAEQPVAIDSAHGDRIAARVDRDEPVFLTLVGQRALRGEMVDDPPAEHAAAEQVV
jgi:hypothetical protein